MNLTNSISRTVKKLIMEKSLEKVTDMLKDLSDEQAKKESLNHEGMVSECIWMCCDANFYSILTFTLSDTRINIKFAT